MDILYPSQKRLLNKYHLLVTGNSNPNYNQTSINLANSSQPIASILKVGEQKLLEKEFDISDNSKVLIAGGWGRAIRIREAV